MCVCAFSVQNTSTRVKHPDQVAKNNRDATTEASTTFTCSMLARVARNKDWIMSGVHDAFESRQDGLLPHRCPTLVALVVVFSQRYKGHILIFQETYPASSWQCQYNRFGCLAALSRRLVHTAAAHNEEEIIGRCSTCRRCSMECLSVCVNLQSVGAYQDIKTIKINMEVPT